MIGFDRWLSDRVDAAKRAAPAGRPGADRDPRGTSGWPASTPTGWTARPPTADLARMGRGRGIVDFVSSLTDEQAVAFADRLSGASGLLWTTGRSL